MKILPQAYSISDRNDRSTSGRDGEEDGVCFAFIVAFSPSGGGETSLSLKARKSPAPLEEIRGVTRSAMVELPAF